MFYKAARKLDQIEKHLSRIDTKLEQLMLSNKDVSDKIDEAATRQEALIVLAEAQKTNLAEVRKELQDALAANDQPALQAAIDKLQVMEDHANATINDLNPPAPPTPGP